MFVKVDDGRERKPWRNVYTHETMIGRIEGECTPALAPRLICLAFLAALLGFAPWFGASGINSRDIGLVTNNYSTCHCES
jgi:hypothetical protein